MEEQGLEAVAAAVEEQGVEVHILSLSLSPSLSL